MAGKDRGGGANKYSILNCYTYEPLPQTLHSIAFYTMFMGEPVKARGGGHLITQYSIITHITYELSIQNELSLVV